MKSASPAPFLTPYPRALELIEKAIRPLGREILPIEKAMGRYLAAPVKAPGHSPAFAQSSMDGFAVRTDDLMGADGLSPVTLTIVGEMPAGSGVRRRLKSGQTIKVFTGGPLPAGADAVVIVEVVEVRGDQAVFGAATALGANIRPVGAEYARGDVILQAGVAVTPPVIGVLAFLGMTKVTVGKAPRVTVITMGDELVGPEVRLTPGKIHDANGPALLTALLAIGVVKVARRQVGDTPAALKQSLAAALARSDLVITVGGASVGDHDHAASVRRELGIRDLFTRVAIKPGKPNMFGLAPDGTPVFSLPGNPVSALVSFHQLVMPGVKLMMGSTSWAPKSVPAVLSEAAARNVERLEWLRGNRDVFGDRIVARPGSRQESHMLSGLATADLLAEIAQGKGMVAAGEIIRATLLEWNR